MDTELTLTLVLALLAGVVAQSAARHLRVPGIVLLLAVGAGLGPDGLGWVHPRSLGAGLDSIVELAVAVILFEGGLNLEIRRLRREQAAIRRLVTLGAALTLIGGAVTARLLLGWEWMQAVLFGSLVVVTGPTVIGPLVSELRLRARTATVLEAEGVLIDPIGALLAVLALEVALVPTTSTLASGGLGLLVQLGFGALAGLVGGGLIAGLLRARRLVPEGFGNIFTLAAVLALFGGAEALVPHSGILSVALAGVAVGNVRTRVDRDLREFKDQLTVLLIGLLFVLLSADVRFADVAALGWGGVGVVAALVLAVRPLSVALCTQGSELGVRERALVSWIGPRGIVAFAVASLSAAALEGAGLAGGEELRALVFMTIAGTVALAGLTSLPVAQLLGVRLPGRDAVAILGAQGLGLALGSILRDAGQSVVFLDSNPQSSRRAEEAEFPVVFGNALEERTLTRARSQTVRTAIGLTPNDSLNGLFVSRARELCGVPEGLVALTRLRSGVTPELVRDDEARVLFEGPHDVERWDVRSRHGELEVARLVFRRPEAADAPARDAAEPGSGTGELFVIVAIGSGRRTFPMYAAYAPGDGDVAHVALYPPERDAALERLAALGWLPEPAAQSDAGL